MDARCVIVPSSVSLYFLGAWFARYLDIGSIFVTFILDPDYGLHGFRQNVSYYLFSKEILSYFCYLTTSEESVLGKLPKPSEKIYLPCTHSEVRILALSLNLQELSFKPITFCQPRIQQYPDVKLPSIHIIDTIYTYRSLSTF